MKARNLLLFGLTAVTLTLGGPSVGAAEPPAAEPAAAPPALAIGAVMPMAGVKMMGVDGRETTLAGVAGPKGTLVVFSCNHCPWVKAWEPRLVAIGNTWPKRGVGVIAVNANDPKGYPEDGLDGMKQRASQRQMAFPYVVDATSDVARAFGAAKTPEAFLFDKAGKLVYHGAIDDNAKEPGKVKERYLQNALEALTGGKEVAVKETKALGCSIKYRAKAGS
jgi:hypothetical protein